MKHQHNIISPAIFNALFPVGSEVSANVHPGLRTCKVTAPAEELSPAESAFRGDYDNVQNAIISLTWLDAAAVVEAFNKAYPVGTWLWCEKKGNTYALPVDQPAKYSNSGNFFHSQGHPESIANVQGRVSMIIHIEDHGQDFLRWYLNEQNVVVHCAPLQASVWNGNEVIYTDGMDTFSSIVFLNKHNEQKTLNYPVERVERLMEREATSEQK